MRESFRANQKHLNYFDIVQSPYDSMAFLLSLILEFELQYYLNNQTQLTKLSCLNLTTTLGSI